MLRLAAEADLTIEERLIPVTEAHAAAEAFYTSASAFVMPVIEIDGKAIGDGKPGQLTKRLRELYLPSWRGLDEARFRRTAGGTVWRAACFVGTS